MLSPPLPQAPAPPPPPPPPPAREEPRHQAGPPHAAQPALHQPGSPTSTARPSLAGPALIACNPPAGLSARVLRTEVALHARVDSVAPGPGAGMTIAFGSIRDAVRCFEAMAGQPVFDPGAPLQLDWDAGEADAGGRGRGRAGGASHVWCPGTKAEVDQLRRGDTSALLGPGAPPCEHALRVGGRVPGILLAFNAQREALRALDLLVSGGGAQAAAAAASANPTTRPRAPSPASSAEAGELPDEPRDVRGGLDAPCTLWVTNVPSRAAPHDIVRAFGSCGRLVGHKILRSRGGAFVDFASRTDAAKVIGCWFCTEMTLDGGFLCGVWC